MKTHIATTSKRTSEERATISTKTSSVQTPTPCSTIQCNFLSCVFKQTLLEQIDWEKICGNVVPKEEALEMVNGIEPQIRYTKMVNNASISFVVFCTDVTNHTVDLQKGRYG